MPLPRPAGGATHPTIRCPLCGGTVWDNRTRKRTPQSPDYRCRSCHAVCWLNPDDTGWRWAPAQDRPTPKGFIP